MIIRDQLCVGQSAEAGSRRATELGCLGNVGSDESGEEVFSYMQCVLTAPGKARQALPSLEVGAQRTLLLRKFTFLLDEPETLRAVPQTLGNIESLQLLAVREQTLPDLQVHIQDDL